LAVTVARTNEGSKSLWGAIAIDRKDDRLERARANSKKPAAIAKMIAKRTGVHHHRRRLTGEGQPNKYTPRLGRRTCPTFGAKAATLPATRS
jgi:hypothetical protein